VGCPKAGGGNCKTNQESHAKTTTMIAGITNIIIATSANMAHKISSLRLKNNRVFLFIFSTPFGVAVRHPCQDCPPY
jgi:hypothetical protein